MVFTKKIIKIGIIVGFFLILLGIILYSRISNLPERPPQEKFLTSEATLIINFREGKVEKFQKEINNKITAFELLKEGAEELNLSLKTESYDMGVFVEAIGDEENGQDGKYWLYYVNDEMPMVSVDRQEIKAGDRLEFKFGKSPF